MERFFAQILNIHFDCALFLHCIDPPLSNLDWQHLNMNPVIFRYIFVVAINTIYKQGSFQLSQSKVFLINKESITKYGILKSRRKNKYTNSEYETMLNM